jgi:hypothetical protein
MQELPHGFPFTQCGFLVSAEAPLRQELINWLRASAVRAACRRIAVFHSLLSGVLEARQYRQHGHHGDGDQIPLN